MEIPLETFPNDVLIQHVLTYFDYPDLNNVSEVDKRLLSFSKRDELWDRLHKKHFSPADSSKMKTRIDFIETY